MSRRRRTAGALTLSHNESYNIYNGSDTTFFKYRYDLIDAWAGYSIGIKKLTATNNTIRDRRFFASGVGRTHRGGALRERHPDGVSKAGLRHMARSLGPDRWRLPALLGADVIFHESGNSFVFANS